MKVAIVYDRVNKWGGAERVVLSLLKIFPNAPVFTSVYEKNKASWARELDIKTSILQKFSLFRSRNELLFPLMPIAFENFSFDESDVVISITSEASKGVITKPHTLHICYCLTPTRYLWSGYTQYFNNRLLRRLARPVISYMRGWDKAASSRPDHYIAISSEVKSRIKKYYGKDSVVIFPPLATDGVENKSTKKGDYFLLVSRLSKFVSYKKVDMVIRSFNELGWNLKIIGEGSSLSSLKKQANSNIEFLGKVSDEELWEYYRGSKAFIFPAIEDFGLAMAEAQYFGKPVIAMRGGGALDIVVEGETGEFINEQNQAEITSVLKKFDSRRYNDKIIKENADRFSGKKFQIAFKNFVDSKYEEHVRRFKL